MAPKAQTTCRTQWQQEHPGPQPEAREGPSQGRPLWAGSQRLAGRKASQSHTGVMSAFGQSEMRSLSGPCGRRIRLAIGEDENTHMSILPT